jgi:hypothetical protein
MVFTLLNLVFFNIIERNTLSLKFSEKLNVMDILWEIITSTNQNDW